MGDPRFKNDNEKEKYYSVLERIYNAIHLYENNGELATVDDNSYENIEEDLKADINAKHLLNGTGHPTIEETDLFELFSPFIFGTEGKDYARWKNNFIFCVPGDPEKDGLYYRLTVDNNGVKTTNTGKSLEEIKENPLIEFEDKPSDEQIQSDKELTRLINQKNKKDLAEFGKYANILREAAKTTSRDSNEYKNIIKMLDSFQEKGVDFSTAEEPGPSDWRKLDEKQRLALPMHLLKDKIDEYLVHKAKDGVKPNTYHKLAALEELNQYLEQRIGEIRPITFKFNGKSYSTDRVQRGYVSELNYINKVRQSEGKKPLAKHGFTYKELGAYITGSRNYNFESGRPEPFDIHEMAAVGLCMDRIILKAQTTFEGKKRDEVVDDLEHARDNLIYYHPQPKLQTANAEKEAKHNAPVV